MAWSTPRTWTVGELLTAANFNTFIRDQQRYGKGLDGPVQFDDNITFPGSETVDGVDVSAHAAGDAMAQHAAGVGTHSHESSGAQGGQIDSDAISGRLTTSQIPTGTAGYVLKGQGVGVDSVFVDEQWKASDSLKQSNTNDSYTESTSYVKLRETELDEAFYGAMRVKFSMRLNTSSGGYGRLYKDSIAWGTERYQTDYNEVTYSQDFTSLSLSSGTLIQVYAKNTSGAGYRTYIRNLNECFEVDRNPPTFTNNL